MNNKSLTILSATLMAISTLACGNKTASSTDVSEAGANSFDSMPSFCADSAYSYVNRQVKMGPRVPGSEGHTACAGYLISELKRHGADTVIDQATTVTAFTGDRLPIHNIMGRFNPDVKRRVLLVAHWDTRPWADNDPNEKNHKTPVLGANDGASGVGVLLELARQFSISRPSVGVDILFVDAEDYGNSGGFSNNPDSWCLGTQYWIQNMPYGVDDIPAYAILLDMVGGKSAVFNREYGSVRNAPGIVEHVWDIAARSGFSSRFHNEVAGGIIDDHIYLQKAGIPSIDIIECNNYETKSFPSTWHTVKDDMDSIDPSTLKAVGQTVLNTVYSENPQ